MQQQEPHFQRIDMGGQTRFAAVMTQEQYDAWRPRHQERGRHLSDEVKASAKIAALGIANLLMSGPHPGQKESISENLRHIVIASELAMDGKPTGHLVEEKVFSGVLDVEKNSLRIDTVKDARSERSNEHAVVLSAKDMTTAESVQKLEQWRLDITYGPPSSENQIIALPPIKPMSGPAPKQTSR